MKKHYWKIETTFLRKKNSLFFFILVDRFFFILKLFIQANYRFKDSSVHRDQSLLIHNHPTSFHFMDFSLCFILPSYFRLTFILHVHFQTHNRWLIKLLSCYQIFGSMICIFLTGKIVIMDTTGNRPKFTYKFTFGVKWWCWFRDNCKCGTWKFVNLSIYSLA